MRGPDVEVSPFQIQSEESALAEALAQSTRELRERESAEDCEFELPTDSSTSATGAEGRSASPGPLVSVPLNFPSGAADLSATEASAQARDREGAAAFDPQRGNFYNPDAEERGVAAEFGGGMRGFPQEDFEWCFGDKWASQLAGAGCFVTVLLVCTLVPLRCPCALSTINPFASAAGSLLKCASS